MNSEQKIPGVEKGESITISVEGSQLNLCCVGYGGFMLNISLTSDNAHKLVQALTEQLKNLSEISR